MGAIWSFFVHTYATLAIIPIIPFVIIYFGYGAYKRDRKKGFRLAMDVTTFLLIGIDAALFDLLFDSKFGIYGILLVMLIGGGLLGNAQYRKRGTVDAKKIFRTIWRLGFFVLGLFYVLLVIIAIFTVLFSMNK